mmetsp:Transcript_8345/g.30833  ORF Transcript_8345/g.30833 Transcript_8345/m.30833 type:complete len:292 (-) Transcript_8345:46-921(-)
MSSSKQQKCEGSIFSQVLRVKKDPHLSRHTKQAILDNTNHSVQPQSLVAQDYFGHYINRRDRQLIRKELTIILNEGGLRHQEQASIFKFIQLMDQPSSKQEFFTVQQLHELRQLLEKGKTVALATLFEELYEHEMGKRAVFFNNVSDIMHQKHMLQGKHVYNLNHESDRIAFIVLIEAMLKYLLPSRSGEQESSKESSHDDDDWYSGYVWNKWHSVWSVFQKPVDYVFEVQFPSKHELQRFLFALRERIHCEVCDVNSMVDCDDVENVEEIAFFLEEDIWEAFVRDESNNE